MAPLPSNERVKALAIVDGKIAAWVVGTGPSGAGEPWVEQWFFFGDESASGTYGDYPDVIPELLPGLVLAYEPLPNGHPPLSPRPGRAKHKRRREVKKLLTSQKTLGPDVEVDEKPEITWYTYPPSGSDIGVYHAAGSPANDDPEAFFDHGLKDLLDEFGRVDLDGLIGYVYGETRRKVDQVLSTTADQNDWIENLCADGEVPDAKVVRLYRGATLVGYAYSRAKQAPGGDWTHRRGVHQFIVDGVQVHVPSTQTRMKEHTKPDDADWTTAKNFAAWLASVYSDWPKRAGNVPEECDYYYGCAYVTLDCDPDQNDRPQTPAQYPGS